jgi:hypothetical protein
MGKSITFFIEEIFIAKKMLYTKKYRGIPAAFFFLKKRKLAVIVVVV